MKDGGQQELSYAALADKARQIGVTVRGKKAQLAALIADAIKAKAGIAKRMRADKKALAETEARIREHPLYEEMDRASRYVEADIDMGLEGRTRRGRVDPSATYYVDPGYRGEVQGMVGRPGAAGYNAKLV